MTRIRAMTSLASLLLGLATVASCVSPAATGSSLSWEPCGDGAVQCTTVPVPVDRPATDGPLTDGAMIDGPVIDSSMIDIAVAKLPARDAATRRGTVIVHAGGPAPSLPLLTDPRRRTAVDELITWFDVVTFDSRGYGESAPLCDAALAPPLNLLSTDAERAAHADAQRLSAERESVRGRAVRRS